MVADPPHCPGVILVRVMVVYFVRGFEVSGAFDYFFPAEDVGADQTYWEINANLVGTVLLGVKAMKGGYFQEAFRSYQEYQRADVTQPA